MIPHFLASDPTGATTAAAILAVAAVALITSLFLFANAEAADNEFTSVAHSRWATPADLVARLPKKPEAQTTGTPATRENRARLALDPSPFLGAFRDPLNRHAPPIDLRYTGEKNLLCFGAPGTSKSTALAAVNLLLLKRSAVVFDPKGQLYRITANARRRMGSKVILINPCGVLQDKCEGMESDGWNPLAELDPQGRKFYSKAKTIADAIAEKTGNAKSDFFEDSMVELVTIFCMRERLENGSKANLRNVRSAMSAPRALFLAALNEMRTQDKYYSMKTSASAAYNRLTDTSGQTTSLLDVISTTIKNTDFLNDDLIAEDMDRGGGIDFANMHDELTTVYVVLPMGELENQKRYLRMFINLAIESFFETSPPEPAPLPPVMMLLDECGNLGRLPQLLRAITALRDYRVQLFLFFQGLGQLKKHYPHEEWSLFFAGSGAIVNLAVGAADNNTSEHFSKALGRREVSMTSANISGAAAGGKGTTGGATVSTQVFDLMPPEEFYRLRKGETINIIEGCRYPVRGTALGYWQLFDESEVDPNPYYRG